MTALIFDFDAPLPRRLYWDASFFVHATYPAGRYHQECYAFFRATEQCCGSPFFRFHYEAMEYMDSYSLLPRDALHLATMSRHGVDNIVTTDRDFLVVDGLQIYTCNPDILSRP